MSTKAEISQISKLNLKKYRDSEQKFIAEGKRLVLEGLKSNYNCTKIIISHDFQNRESELLHSLDQYFKNIIFISNKDFTKLSSTKNPQGIAAVFDIPVDKIVQKLDNLIIGFENISDPGNVGTILRTCDWFGIKTVLLSSNCADIYNAKVLRASMGAVFNLRIEQEVDLISRISELKNKNYKSYFADMTGMDYRLIDTNDKMILIFCNEAFGPSEELKKVCDSSVTIPKKGNIDSLNVAAAAAVILAKFG